MSGNGSTQPARIITLDLTDWPQVKIQVTQGIPIAHAIGACESAIQQLREILIEAEVQRRVNVALATRTGDGGDEDDGLAALIEVQHKARERLLADREFEQR